MGVNGPVVLSVLGAALALGAGVALWASEGGRLFAETVIAGVAMCF